MYIDFYLKRKKIKGTGIDISKLAIKTAKTNAKIQQVYNRTNINTDVDKLYYNKYDLHI